MDNFGICRYGQDISTDKKTGTAGFGATAVPYILKVYFKHPSPPMNLSISLILSLGNGRNVNGRIAMESIMSRNRQIALGCNADSILSINSHFSNLIMNKFRTFQTAYRHQIIHHSADLIHTFLQKH